METESLKVIDISGLSFDDVDRVQKLVKDVTEACEQAGFFYLKIEENFGRHCVNVVDAARQVFQLSNDEKLTLVNDESSRMKVKGVPIAGTGAGLRPIGEDPNFVEDCREIFNISVPILKDEDSIDQFNPNYSGNGKNKWPNPSAVKPNWREAVETYASKCLDACRVLARIFALALGVDKNFFDQPGYFDNPTCLLGMNRYHFPANLWKQGDQFGVKPHFDSGVFTFLLTDGKPGLERCVNRKLLHETTKENYDKRLWLPVPSPAPEDGLLIVNLGKNMDYLAGGKFRATLHRVVNKIGETRYSLPFFYEPNMEAVLKPLICDGDPRKKEMIDYMKTTFGKDMVTPADLFYERLEKRHSKTFDP